MVLDVGMGGGLFGELGRSAKMYMYPGVSLAEKGFVRVSCRSFCVGPVRYGGMTAVLDCAISVVSLRRDM